SRSRADDRVGARAARAPQDTALVSEPVHSILADPASLPLLDLETLLFVRFPRQSGGLVDVLPVREVALLAGDALIGYASAHGSDAGAGGRDWVREAGVGD